MKISRSSYCLKRHTIIKKKKKTVTKNLSPCHFCSWNPPLNAHTYTRCDHWTKCHQSVSSAGSTLSRVPSVHLLISSIYAILLLQVLTFDSWGSHASHQNHCRPVKVSRVALLTQSMALLKGATLILCLHRGRPILLSSIPYKALASQSNRAWLFTISYVYSFMSFWLWTFFFLCHPCLAPFPPSQLLLIIQAPTCLLLPLWSFLDTPQQSWLVFCVPTALCSDFCCKYLTHQIIIIDFVCLSLWYKIALNGHLPSHVKENKHKPDSLLDGNFTWF